MYLLFFYFLELINCKTIAVLINTSKNFFNFRHTSNVFTLNYSLKNLGIEPENIYIFQRENLFEDPRNTKKYQLISTDQNKSIDNKTDKSINKNMVQNNDKSIDRIFINKNESVEYKNVPTYPLTEHFILNLFFLRHKFLYKLNNSDSLIFYMCGHAREEFFKISDRFFIFKNDIMRAIYYLSKRLSKVLIILDTCQAESLIDPLKISKNIAIITTSSNTEFSYSHSVIPFLGVSGIDDSTYKIYKNKMSINGYISKYFEDFNDGTLRSTIKCHGNRTFKFSDFLRDENDIKPFEL